MQQVTLDADVFDVLYGLSAAYLSIREGAPQQEIDLMLGLVGVNPELMYASMEKANVVWEKMIMERKSNVSNE